MAPSTLDGKEDIDLLDPSVKRYIKEVKGVESFLELNPSWLPTLVPKNETYVEGQAYAETFEFVLEWRWQDFAPDWSQPFLQPIVESNESNDLLIEEWEQDSEELEESLMWCFLGRVFCEFKILKLSNSEEDEDDCGEKIEHCKCGLGCPLCYGKVNCGCPECYRPGKKRKELKEIIFKSALEIPQISYENCTISQVNEDKQEIAKVNKLTIKELKVTKRRPISFEDKPDGKAEKRTSLPAVVAPPQQTKYFCKTCGWTICNSCFTNVCKGHNVQYLGSARFHCQAKSHVNNHQFSIFVRS